MSHVSMYNSIKKSDNDIGMGTLKVAFGPIRRLLEKIKCKFDSVVVI